MIFNTWSYQKKTKGIVIASVLFILVAYRISISSTLDEIEKHSELSAQLDKAENASQRIDLAKQKLASLDQLIGIGIAENIDFQDLLLDVVSDYCSLNGIILSDMQFTYAYKKGNYNIETNVFAVEGKFRELLLLMYQLETKYKTGQIVSAHYEVKQDYVSKKKRLFLQLYFQNINQHNEN